MPLAMSGGKALEAKIFRVIQFAKRGVARSIAAARGSFHSPFLPFAKAMMIVCRGWGIC
jgi:hypothetical protein